MKQHGEVLAFDSTILHNSFLAQNSLVVIPLAFRPDNTIRIGSQVGGFANGIQRKVYGEVRGNVVAVGDNLRVAAALAMQEAARISFELPSGYAGDAYHHNGSRNPEIFAPPQLVDRLKNFEPGAYVGFLALTAKTLFEPFRQEEFGGTLFTRAQGVQGMDVHEVYGLTTSNIASLLGPQGFDGLTDGVLEPRLWPTYRLLNLRLGEVPPES